MSTTSTKFGQHTPCKGMGLFPAAPPTPSPGLSPIPRLPFELLQVLFIHASESEGAHAHYDTVKSLCLVCRLWNVIVMETPALWAQIDTALGATFVRRLLELSKSHLLRVHCDIDLTHVTPTSGAHTASLLLAFTHVSRWHEVRVRSPHFEDISYLCSMIAPRLKSLSIEYEPTIPQTGSGTTLNFRSDCPQLRNLSIGRIYTDWNAPVFLQLESIDFVFYSESVLPTSGQILNILDRNPYLQSMTLAYGSRFLPRPVVRLYTSLPRSLQVTISNFKKPAIFAIVNRLRSATKTRFEIIGLGVTDSSPEDGYQVINTLLPSIPHFQVLILSIGPRLMSIAAGLVDLPYPSSVSLYNPPISTMLRWLVDALQQGTLATPSRMSCHIVGSGGIFGGRAMDQGVLSLLDSLPSVRSVQCDGAQGIQEFCDLLAMEENRESLPEMEELTFKHRTIDVGIVVKLLQARYGHLMSPRISPLKRLILRTKDGEEPKDIHKLTSILGDTVLEVLGFRTGRTLSSTQ